nr:mediator of rna polymerase ii transcription subunit 33a [Quercus suber]
MENAMDGKQLLIKSAVDVLAESIKTLQVFNQASWLETFLVLWLSALQLERDPLEGPIPHLEARLCVLLSIVPLAIANVLGHFSSLLYPHASVVDAANTAARKAASFISSGKNERNIVGGGSHVDTSIRAGANMRHLIVEACVARNLVDTLAYFWPGYVSASIISLSDSLLVEISPWSTFMEGAPLNASLINSLIKTPASSLAEIEKLYYIALNGSEEEKSAAAKILCGASTHLEEHVVHFVVKLLSPPVPPSYTGPGSHLIDDMSMLSALLFGASAINTVHILSLHVHSNWGIAT